MEGVTGVEVPRVIPSPTVPDEPQASENGRATSAKVVLTSTSGSGDRKSVV